MAGIQDKFDLSGKCVVITGASGARGVGAAMARAFHNQGAAIANLDVADGMGLLPDRYKWIRCDATDEPSVQAAVGAVAAFAGRVDVLVNNAGIIAKSTMEEFPMDQFRRVMDVNTIAAAQTTKHFLPLLKQSPAGRIINISSIQAFMGTPVYSAYSASKAAIIGLTRVWAMELVADGITVNAICPSFVHTDMFERALSALMTEHHIDRDAAIQRMVGACPQKRPIQPEEVGDVAVFLASDMAKGMTGQSIHLDGGMVL